MATSAFGSEAGPRLDPIVESLSSNQAVPPLKRATICVQEGM